MRTAKLPKSEWNRIDERNSGHTKEEWGQTRDTNVSDKIRVIEAYTVLWDNQEDQKPLTKWQFGRKKYP